jgi:preprotein translocase subunit SecY
MLKAFINMWRVPELRNKLLFTLGMLLIYRIGFFIPLLGIDQEALSQWAENQQNSALGNLISFVGMFTGGSFSQSTIFGLGIMPYISAAIIFQLLTTALPSLKALQKEGPAGRQKIQEYTRYATVGLCIVQAVGILALLRGQENGGLVDIRFRQDVAYVWAFWICGILGLTAGTVFLMWLGEQIDKHGIGNGISLIITAGIVASMPTAITLVIAGFDVGGGGKYGPGSVLFLLLAFVCVVAGAIVITQGQRRIPVQQAKHTRGRRVFGGQRSYLPLRVNHGGVMPIIFASSLMMFPSMLLTLISSSVKASNADSWLMGVINFLNRSFQMDSIPYSLIYIGLIYFFAYFWTTVQFQPKEMATQLRDSGSFIPGLRPGPRTAEYLETVMERITYAGAGFLALIAVIPTVVWGTFGVDFIVTQFLGGTGLLIVVSVMLDFVTRIEASLMMRGYAGFLGGGGHGGSGPKIRGSRR